MHNKHHTHIHTRSAGGPRLFGSLFYSFHNQHQVLVEVSGSSQANHVQPHMYSHRPNIGLYQTSQLPAIPSKVPFWMQ